MSVMNMWSICDRCSFKYKRGSLRREATGMVVCTPCYDGMYDRIRHPQNYSAKPKPEPRLVPDGRPDVVTPPLPDATYVLNASLRISPNSPDMRAAVSQALAAFFAPLPNYLSPRTISFSALSAAVAAVSGLSSFSFITPTADINLTFGQNIVLNSVSYSYLTDPLPQVSGQLRIAALGDSRVWDMWLSPNPTFRRGSPGSFFGDTLNAAVWYQVGDLIGTVGHTSAQILANVSTVLARPNTDAILVFSGNNSIFGGTALATIQSQIKDTVLQLRAANKRVIYCTETVRDTYTALQISDTLALNAWAKNTLSYLDSNIVVADIASVLQTSAGVQIAGMFRDGIHVGPNGGRAAGAVIDSAAAAVATYPSSLSTVDGDPNNAWATPLFTTGGGAPANGVTGTLPLNTVGISSLGGFTSGTVVCSLVSRAAGGKWAQLTLTNATAATNSNVIAIQLGSFTKPSWLTTGDYCSLYFDVEIDPGCVNFNGPLSLLGGASGGSVSSTNFSDAVAGTQFNLSSTYRGVIRSPAYQIQSGDTSLYARLCLDARTTSGATGVIRFGAPTIVKIPTGFSTS